MRKLLIAGTAATALAAAFPATGKCLDDLNKARDELSKNEQFKQWNATGRFEADYRRLVAAATIFSENNLEDRCMDVVKGIRELASKVSADDKSAAPGSRTDRAAPGTGDRAATTPPPAATTPPPATTMPADRDRTTTEKSPTTTTPAPGATERKAAEDRRDTTTTPRRDTTTERRDTTDRRDVNTDRKQVIASAQPMASATVSADALIGADVRNSEDRDLGEVSDVELKGGNIQAVIIGRGGFLGLGASHYRIEPAKLRITPDNKMIVVDMTEDQIKAMPKVTKKDGQWVMDTDRDRSDTPRRDTNAPAPTQPRK
jgi:hypothetical protein